MITFLCSIALLIGGYFLYGKLVEKAVDIVQELSRDAELLRSSR